MAFFGVTVETIGKVSPHPNADRLSLAQVAGLSFQFVIGKDQFKIGDSVLYFPVDAILPEPILEKLNLKGKLAGKNQNRVKTIKLRSEISQGLVCPVSDFLTPEQSSWSPEKITEFLGVTKYEPPVNITMDAILSALPDGLSVYDVEGADRYQDVVDLLMEMDVVVMEKMEGANYSAGKTQETLFVNSRNNTIIEKEGVPHTYWEYARNNIFPGIKTIPANQLSVYSEFCGPKSQDNIYKLKNHTAYIFDIKKDGKWLDWPDVVAIAQILNVPTVPVLFQGKLKDFLKGQTIQEASNGKSLINPQILREGIVVKPLLEHHYSRIGRLIIKQRSPLYLAGSDF